MLLHSNLVEIRVSITHTRKSASLFFQSALLKSSEFYADNVYVYGIYDHTRKTFDFVFDCFL